MKYALVFLMTAVTATSAFAGSRYCLDAKLTENSHPSLTCPAATEICVKNLVTTAGKESAKSLILVNGNKKTLELPFDEFDDRVHQDDISTRVIYYFDKDGVRADYEVESDNWYPYPTITGTFTNLTVWTGKKSNDKTTLYSQACKYEVIK